MNLTEIYSKWDTQHRRHLVSVWNVRHTGTQLSLATLPFADAYQMCKYLELDAELTRYFDTDKKGLPFNKEYDMTSRLLSAIRASMTPEEFREHQTRRKGNNL